MWRTAPCALQLSGQRNNDKFGQPFPLWTISSPQRVAFHAPSSRPSSSPQSRPRRPRPSMPTRSQAPSRGWLALRDDPTRVRCRTAACVERRHFQSLSRVDFFRSDSAVQRGNQVRVIAKPHVTPTNLTNDPRSGRYPVIGHICQEHDRGKR